MTFLYFILCTSLLTEAVVTLWKLSHAAVELGSVYILLTHHWKYQLGKWNELSWQLTYDHSGPIQSLFIFCQLETFKISLFWGPVSWVTLGKFHWKFIPFTQTNASKNIFECFAGYEWKFFPHQTLVFSLQSSRLNVINDKCLFYCSQQKEMKFSLKEEFLKDLSSFLPN